VRRPILIGGLGLTAALWLFDSLHHWASEIGTVGIVAIAGVGFWWVRQKKKQAISVNPVASVDRTAVKNVIQETQALLQQLALETVGPESARSEHWEQQILNVQTQVQQVLQILDQVELTIAVIGGPATGKTTLVKLLETWAEDQALSDRLQFLDTPALLAGTDSLDSDQMVWQVVHSVDLLFFVVTGDLTASEHQLMIQLRDRYQPTYVVFNKQDQFLPLDRSLILQTIQHRLHGLVDANQIFPISAVASTIKVRQHQVDGSEHEYQESVSADLKPLVRQLQHLVDAENNVQDLHCSRALRAGLALKKTVQTQLNQVRYDRALPVIEQFQWIAAATAFANPVPALDLLATAAINTQLILDLGVIYQQQFSISQAQAMAGALAKLLVKLGLVELSSRAIATVLKSNTVTFVAGGLLQGMSAAYLTRLAGLSLIEYFQEQDVTQSKTSNQPLRLDYLSQKLQHLFQQTKQESLLNTWVQQGLQRFGV
jgi:uncharacterized protein